MLSQSVMALRVLLQSIGEMDILSHGGRLSLPQKEVCREDSSTER